MNREGCLGNASSGWSALAFVAFVAFVVSRYRVILEGTLDSGVKLATRRVVIASKPPAIVCDFSLYRTENFNASDSF